MFKQTDFGIWGGVAVGRGGWRGAEVRRGDMCVGVGEEVKGGKKEVRRREEVKGGRGDKRGRGGKGENFR